MAIFILKVLILSVGVSILIKYAAPSLPIPPTSLNALIGVMTPTIALAIALWWRAEGRGVSEQGKEKIGGRF